MKTTDGGVAQAITESLISPNECDRNFEPANVVDGLFAIARAIHRLATAVEGKTENQAPASHPPRSKVYGSTEN